MKTYTNVHEAYLKTLEDVFTNPEFVCSPRGQEVRECLNYSFKVINPKSESIITKDLERNKTIEEYTKKELELYNSGTNSAEDFSKASKFWLKLANVDGTVNSAYGHLVKFKKSHGNPMYELGVDHDMLNQTPVGVAESIAQRAGETMRTPWQWCVESLREDKDTRQAVLRFSLPEHFYKGNKDLTCTLEGNFHIRQDKLYFSIHMRSNDLVKGLVYDMPYFVGLMYEMRDELLDLYPKLEIGSYTHTVDSIHVYSRDEEKVNKMIGRI